MKIVNDPGIDRITRDLSGAMWIFSRLREDDNSTATFIHRCFQREIWREIRLRDRVAICAVLPAVPFVIMAVTTVLTALTIDHLGTGEQRQRYLPGAVSGTGPAAEGARSGRSLRAGAR